jgi:hypothetical protein
MAGRTQKELEKDESSQCRSQTRCAGHPIPAQSEFQAKPVFRLLAAAMVTPIV